jgi:hypothetical protein
VSQEARALGEASRHQGGQGPTGVGVNLVARFSLKTPVEVAREMVAKFGELAKEAAAGAPREALQAKADAWQAAYGNESAFPAVDHLWSPEGRPVRDELAAAQASLAAAAPDIIFRGSVMESERKSLPQADDGWLRSMALEHLSQPRNAWQRELGNPDVSTMPRAELLSFLFADMEAARNRRAATMPLEFAVACAQQAGDQGAVRQAAQAIVNMGDKAEEDLGVMATFYRGLAQAG